MDSPHAPVSEPLRKGPVLAMLAALLFGVSTPLGKNLSEHMSPQWFGGLLCLGSGGGLLIWMLLRRIVRPHAPQEAALSRKDLPFFGLSLLFGGILAPVLLAYGLRHTPASTASLLLNLEGVLTALLAWFVFHEHFDRRIFFGMLAILGGAALLSATSARSETGIPWNALAIAGACLCWALDNNVTRKISNVDPVQITALKGVPSGILNLLLAASAGQTTPTPLALLQGATLGFFSYGLSLVCFVLALRHIGTARTGAYFSTAPFIGSALALLLTPERPAPAFWIAAALMALGVLLHLTEEHNHFHRHEALEHEHLHYHDAHHQHPHGPDDPPGEPHSHWHRHEPLEHAHPHYPDIHHQHRH